MRGPRKPRLLVLNQYYWPGVEATAQLLTDLCEAFAAEIDVTVVTGVLHGHEDEPRRLAHNGVRIVRVPSTSFERSRLLARASNYATYLAGALLHGLRVPRPDVVLCMTDPPIVADVALVVAKRYRAPLIVISQDVFPEIAVQLKRLENPIAMRLLRSLVSLYLRRADRIVAIGDTMRRRLEEKGARPERLRVIPNWVDTARLEPQPRVNWWREKRGAQDKFVVMHSGNVGHAQDLDSLVRAATFLRDLGRRHPRRRARAGSRRVCRAEPALRDPRGRAARDRRSGAGKRDGAGGGGGRLRHPRAARASGAARACHPRRARRQVRPHGDGQARPRLGGA